MTKRLGRKKRPEAKPTIGSELGRCSTSGKIRWPSRSDARFHVRHLRARGDDRARALGAYRCVDGCGDWHVGHSSLGGHARG